MSGQTLQRAWTFLTGLGAAPNAKSATPFLRRLLPSTAPLPDVITWLNLLVGSIDEATRGSRSLPFGAGGTVYDSIVFQSGVLAKIPHLLGTTNVFALFTAPSVGIIDTATVTFDSTYCYINPGANFTCGIVFLVRP